MDIAGINAVVTGAASGLGRATAEHLLDHGAKVVLTDLASSRCEEVAAELGRGARFVAADVTSEADVSAVFARAEEIGPVRAVVHCAGRSGAPECSTRKAGPARSIIMPASSTQI